MEAQKEPKLIAFDVVREIPREEKLRILEKVSKQPLPQHPDLKNLKRDELILPDDNGEPREHFGLLEETFDIALPRLLALLEKYPPDCYITIGQSSIPLDRETKYHSIGAFIKRGPEIWIEEHILFRSNNRFNVLLVEYLLQHHLAVGLWKDIFEVRCNPQQRIFPQLLRLSGQKEYEVKPYYVYCQFSSSPATFSVKYKKSNVEAEVET